jgi:uncharacterized protein YbjT (DUF2867 family)
MCAAFVAGATGYTGREVVRLLAAEGRPVIAHVRPDSPRLDAWRERFVAMGAKVDSTPWRQDAMSATLLARAPAAVYALLGTTRARAKGGRGSEVPETYEAVDYGLTAMLVAAAMSVTPPPRFVYLSALGVGPGSSNPYVRVRHRLETELQASGLPFTIVRPGFISGPDRDEGRPAERAGATLSQAAAALLTAVGARRLGARVRPIDSVALATELIRLADDPNAAGHVVRSEELARSR